ncbi:hypothetical protein BN1723_008419 [Verticillium longisporum]|uniref:Uncharacterized protein n=1 Tax=Verticillium longisporum TaxID=100787 RepID=A0A0G4KFA3_VERLO|nr:hypothetical protein BN1723_008419 [Verticillium longisporum]
MASLRFSPLTLVLGSIFFFTSQVFAVSAVLGVDLGTEYIKAALVKPGIPLEILTKEAERLRHILSANSNSQANFEGLYEDVDFKYKIDRTDFEKLAEAYAVRVGTVIQDALKAAQLELTDLDSVILHGGASRTPFVQKQLEEAVGSADKIRSNVNSDESAVFGAGFRAAELSPSFRVKEIRLSEGAMYPSGIKWTNPKQKEQHQRLWSAVSPMGAAPKEKRVEETETRPELVKALKDALDQSIVFVDKIKDQIKSYEEFHAAAQAASSDTSTATEESASSSSTDSDGVEDDTAAEKPRDMEDVIKEDGPIPPLYKMEDVDVIDKLHEDISSWITEMEAKQAALPPTADPVLLAKDLKSRREKLDKAGVDLAMKGVKSFEKKNKKAGSSNKKAKTATVATGDASDGPEPIHINLGEDGKAPTEEEIQEILRKLQESQEPARERDELWLLESWYLYIGPEPAFEVHWEAVVLGKVDAKQQPAAPVQV